MKKTDRKREKALVDALTHVCDEALEDIDGFSWLTHFVNYDDYPASIVVVCVFEEDEQLQRVRKTQQDRLLCARILLALECSALALRIGERQIRLDTQEACDREHGGDWSIRYGHGPSSRR